MLLAVGRKFTSLSSSRSCRHFSAPVADGNVLTFKPDLEFWKLTTLPQGNKIKDFSTKFNNGEVALTEDYFDTPHSRLCKPFTETAVFERSFVWTFLENGVLDEALKHVSGRLHDYEILIWTLIAQQGSSAHVSQVFHHAVSKSVPLTTTFIGQVMEAYVAAHDYHAAQQLFEDAQTKYKLPLTSELVHKFIGLFQLNKEYADKVADARLKFSQISRSRDFSDLRPLSLEEVDGVAVDPTLAVPAAQEQAILKDFARNYLVQAPFEVGMKEWKQRLQNYIQWHKGEEATALSELQRDHTQLLSKYEKRNAQVSAFFDKKFGVSRTPTGEISSVADSRVKVSQ